MSEDERYKQTRNAYRKHKIIQNCIQKNILGTFLAVIIIVLLIYKIVPNLNCDLSFFANLFGIHHLNDGLIIKTITYLTGSFTILISLLSAIYVFTYREQKTISPSGSTDIYKNTLVAKVISLIILNLTFTWLITNEYNKLLNAPEYFVSLRVTEQLILKLLIIGVSIIVLIWQILILIKHLFRTMQVDKMLSDSVEQTFEILKSIYYFHRTDKYADLLDDNYKKFHFSLESVFQNLKFAADHNMNKEFEENIEEFKNIFDFLNSQVSREKEAIHVSTYLLNHDEVKFSQAYQSAIRSNLSLIANLLKNQHYNKAKTLVSLYTKLYNENDVELVKIYQKSLVEFLDVIDVNDERQISIYVECLKALPENKTHVAFNFLLMKLVNKNQLKNLTNVVYIFKNNIRNEKLYRISIVIIIIQNLLKSIEISNPAITGFLVKFLFTNFTGKEVSRGLRSLKRNPKSFTSVLEDKEVIEGIYENDAYAIVSNGETFTYCYQKALIMLYAQRLFTIQNKLWYVDGKETGTEIGLRKEFDDCKYSEYILSKVKVDSNKYGLLFFEDETVMRSVYKELGLKYPEPKKTENNISDTAQLLVRKLFKLDENSTEVK